MFVYVNELMSATGANCEIEAKKRINNIILKPQRKKRFVVVKGTVAKFIYRAYDSKNLG